MISQHEYETNVSSGKWCLCKSDLKRILRNFIKFGLVPFLMLFLTHLDIESPDVMDALKSSYVAFVPTAIDVLQKFSTDNASDETEPYEEEGEEEDEETVG